MTCANRASQASSILLLSALCLVVCCSIHREAVLVVKVASLIIYFFSVRLRQNNAFRRLFALCVDVEMMMSWPEEDQPAAFPACYYLR